MGRYKHVAEYFCDRQFIVCTFDLRGHGISGGKKGHIPSYHLLLDDVEKVVKQVRETYPQLPFFLYGHSMGGNIAANYILRRDIRNITGAVITSPWLRLGFAPSIIKLFLGRWMNKIFPSFTQSTGLDAHQLTHDSAIAKAYQEDPLVHGSISAAAFMCLHESGEWAIAHAHQIKIPTLVMHGSEDKITSTAATEEFASNAGHLVTFKMWKGLRHETHNELEKEKVLDFIAHWLMQVIQKAKVRH
jgi:alpha-beta hydrolase superfamily lysophospholipase